jgi:hypothetical protein
MSEVRVKVDVYTQSAEFHGSSAGDGEWYSSPGNIHPTADVGDLRAARFAFDRLVVAVRAWFDSQHAPERPAA